MKRDFMRSEVASNYEPSVERQMRPFRPCIRCSLSAVRRLVKPPSWASVRCSSADGEGRPATPIEIPDLRLQGHGRAHEEPPTRSSPATTASSSPLRAHGPSPRPEGWARPGSDSTAFRRVALPLAETMRMRIAMTAPVHLWEEDSASMLAFTCLKHALEALPHLDAVAAQRRGPHRRRAGLHVAASQARARSALARHGRSARPGERSLPARSIRQSWDHAALHAPQRSICPLLLARSVTRLDVLLIVYSWRSGNTGGDRPNDGTGRPQRHDGRALACHRRP